MAGRSILVTGATGFLGSSLVRHLASSDAFFVKAPVRHLRVIFPVGVEILPIEDLDASTNWQTALLGVEFVVHTSARVHVMSETAKDPLVEFRKVNVEGTLNLARQAAAAGVKRFIFISSIKVNGESTLPGKPFSAHDAPAPKDAYGVSKLEAEKGLYRLAASTGMEVVIIRPVLVYGPRVRANFLSMMQWLSKGIPLPLGAVHNQRSLVSLENLISLIVSCINHPRAANQTFLVSDGQDISTEHLLKKLASALGKPARLMPVPVWLMHGVAVLLGRRDLSSRLFGSLQVDISKNRELLGWTPPVSLDQGLRLTAQHFLESRNS
ncbi:SDR family oxidoreductase [Pseudomonas sp. CCI1.2]|uniref:UDP-glucose 4-epimerase family protein n=1 Tax=Pseudomonas sp. CCI1.2 TaxID=3048614 RepID=UPI002B22D454|nr:SDR family oxidoreductase [Pseudomonas sp. CCI1.2]MEB0122553.1 SDR family oxidoreductase [Pseudomonas sp. CCI1.2]